MNEKTDTTPEPTTTFRDDPPKPKPVEQPAAEPDKVAAGDAPEPDQPTPEPAERRVKL